MLFTTKKEGAQLRADLKTLKEESSTQREALDEQLRRAKTQVEQLEKVLAEATQFLARNNADVGAQVQKLQATIDALEGKLDETRHELDLLRQEMRERQTRNHAQSAGAPQVPEAPPPTKDALFADAERLLKEKRYEEARRAARLFVDRHGDDPRVDNARLFVGEAYFAEGRYAAAIGEYQKVIDAHPDGDVTDDAFLRNGMAFYKLKSCSDARVFLQEMLRRFPKSPLVKKAKETLDEIEKVRKDRSKCSG